MPQRTHSSDPIGQPFWEPAVARAVDDRFTEVRDSRLTGNRLRLRE